MPGEQPLLYFHSRRHWSKRNSKTFPRYFGLKNAATLLARHIEKPVMHLPAHFPCIFSKTAFSQLFELFPDDWSALINSPFRATDEGFIPSALHHAFLRRQEGVSAAYDCPGVYLGGAEVDALFKQKRETLLGAPAPKYLCLNNLAQLQQNQPELMVEIETHILGHDPGD